MDWSKRPYLTLRCADQENAGALRCVFEQPMAKPTPNDWDTRRACVAMR